MLTTHQFITREGSWQVRFDGGHSPAQMSLTDNNRQLYICVDFLLPRISPNISAKMRNLNYDTLTEYIYYLETMRDLSPEWLIIPGHDWPYFGGNLRLNNYLLIMIIDLIS